MAAIGYATQMSTVGAFALLALLATGQLASAQARVLVDEQEVLVGDFCALYHSADIYIGKTVRVTATYSVGFHQAIFYDEACRVSSERHFTVKATFTDERAGIEAVNRLDRFLKHAKANVARVSVIADFRDDYPSGAVPGGSPRYSLQVRHLLSVETVRPLAPTSP